MRRHTFFLSIVMLGTTTVMCGGLKKPDSKKVSDFLGDSIVAIVSKPDKVKSYLVKPAGEGILTVSNLPVTKAGPDLSKGQIKNVRNMVFKEKSYNFETSKRCAFMPSMVLEFIQGERKLHLVICFSCNEWEFRLGEQEAREDFDGAVDGMIKLKSELFP